MQQEFIPIERRPCNISIYLENALVPLHAQANGLDIGLSFTLTSEIPNKVAIDPEKIGWVITSLIGNAFRYVRHGTRNLPGGSVRLEIAYDNDRKCLFLNVRDDGPGISLERIPWLFGKRSDGQSASGFALKLAHDILVAHGGTIRVESSTEGDQRGTAFFMEVPAPICI